MISQQHAHEIFTESAVSPEVAGQRGYRTLAGDPEDRALLESLGFKPFVWDRDDAYPGLLVPMHNSRGEQCGAQYKPAVPRERVKANGDRVAVKYETPTGAPLAVDVPAFTREHMTNLDLTLWITEGMKKTDALVTQGLPALGLTGVFNWRNKLGTLGDWEDIPLKGRPVAVCFDADAAENRNVQNAMGRLGAWLKSRGASQVHYVVVPPEVNGTAVKGVDDFFAAGGTTEGLAAAKLDSPPGQGAQDAAFTDAFLAEDLAHSALEGRYLWAAGLGWLEWDGRVWAVVPEPPVLEFVRTWAQSRFDEVLAEQSKDKSKNLGAKIQGWRGVLSGSRISAVLKLSRGVPGVYAVATEFDADPDLLTVGNGTVHLPTGTLRPHSPADRITKAANADFTPGLTHPMWSKALEALRPDAVAWYQDRMGQAVTGYMTPDHVLVVSHGSGSNGKSSIVDVVLETLGAYGVQISDRVLMGNANDHPTELMSLRGARYAVLEETPEARRLNVQRLKSTVGTPRMRARYIRENEIEWASTHSIFINTNHQPVINETDHGTWRRLALLTFPFTYRKRESEVTQATDRLGDPAMPYIKGDPAVRAACLAWLVEGARLFYARGRRMLDVAETVEKDTFAWRVESDQVLGFLTECTEFDRDGFVSTEDLLAAFNGWLDGTGHRPWNSTTLGVRMAGHEALRGSGVEQVRIRREGKLRRGWTGLRLTVSANPFNP